MVSCDPSLAGRSVVARVQRALDRAVRIATGADVVDVVGDGRRGSRVGAVGMLSELASGVPSKPECCSTRFEPASRETSAKLGCGSRTSQGRRADSSTGKS